MWLPMRSRVLVGVAALVAALSAILAPPAQAGAARSLPSWRLMFFDATQHFRGLSVVNRNVVWLGGYNGTIQETVDGGKSWGLQYPAGPKSTLQFRDVTAFDRNHAVAMAAGTGTDSRLYVTFNGGLSWKLAYKNHNKAAFFDCMSFFGPKRGLVLSDPVNGKFRILATNDGGVSWRVLPNRGMPKAADGEFAFSASGQCLTTFGRQAWIGSGGAASRIYHSGDGGLTWRAQTTPFMSGASAGVNGLAFRSRTDGIAVGGDFALPRFEETDAAYRQGNRPWQPADRQPTGYRSGVTFLPAAGRRGTAVAVGL